MRTTRRWGPIFAGVALAIAGTAPVPAAAPAPAAAASGGTATSPVATSFVSANVGFALGESVCGAGAWCPTLSTTSDGGLAWTTRRLSGAVARWARAYRLEGPGVLGLDMADARDGWIYGWLPSPGVPGEAPALWSTRDGGATWSRVDLAALGVQTQVLALASGDGRAYLIGGRLSERYGIWQSAVGSGTWRRVPGVAMYGPAGGGEITGAIVLRGDVGWALVGNDRGVTGYERLAAAGTWSSSPDPCHAVGDSYAVPTALSATALEDVCTIGGFGSYAAHPPKGAVMESQWVYASGDGGASFAPVRALDLTGYSGLLYTAPGLPAFLGPRTLLLATYVGASTTSTGTPALIESTDQGSRWSVAYRAAGDETFRAVEFATARLGVAIVQSGDRALLIRTTDAGARWSRVRL